ncbi:hypothetical protein [Actinoplanes solisilvae]|uniref:5'-methylthioadenosine/S-adenosylhomocysteine nucleosidase family protein n=1 Tax=Actinoplanes solisilvae TaxID=2486853 RepID=UPI000FDB1D69|nr:hypothetical protein [Actinoplanes solisilvae]
MNDTGQAPLYLHFLNREIMRAADARAGADRIGEYLVLASLATTGPLVSSLAFVWESGVLESRSARHTANLIASDHLLLLSEFTTLEDFLESCRGLYEHDRRRYPRYFAESVPELYLTARPTVPKNVSTTREISHELLGVVDGRLSGLDGVRPTDASLIVAWRDGLDKVLAKRDGRALTLSLFDGEGPPGTVGAVGRLLSLIHLRHYLGVSGATILRGIPGLGYFDSAVPVNPVHDAQYLLAVFKRIGFHPRAVDPDELVALRGSEGHHVFLSVLQPLVSALHAAAGAHLGLESAAADAGPSLLRRTVTALLNGQSAPWDRQPATGQRPGIDEFSTRLAFLAQALGRRNPRFSAEYREWHSGTAGLTTVLILVAADVERRAFLAAARQTLGTQQITREFLPYHTVFHLGISGNARILMAQAEQGTESPGAMTLTAVDLIDQVKPDYLVLTGICFGLKEDRQSIGDVLVASQIRVMDVKKAEDDADGDMTEILRGDKVSASVTLLDRCRAAAADWTAARVHAGLVLCANSLVNSPTLRARMKALEPDAVGGEMEGAGTYAAGAKRKVDWILVKAIADWGMRKTDDHQELAAANAAAFVLHVVSIGSLAARPGR